jgi:hypothetical protein
MMTADENERAWAKAMAAQALSDAQLFTRYVGADSEMVQWSDDYDGARSAAEEADLQARIQRRLATVPAHMLRAALAPLASFGERIQAEKALLDAHPLVVVTVAPVVEDDGSVANEPYDPDSQFVTVLRSELQRGHSKLTTQAGQIGALMCRVEQLERENSSLCEIIKRLADHSSAAPSVSHENPAAFPLNAIKHSR